MNGSIRRRGKQSWELTIDLGRDEGGKRLRKFVTVQGTKGLAERRLREILVALDKGLPVDLSSITTGQYFERWLRDYVIPNTRPRTAERYESDIRLHIVPALGSIKLSRLAPADIQAMESRHIQDGKSASSVRHIHAVLREALKHAMRWGLIYRNSAEGVDPPRAHRNEIRPPDAETVWRLLDLAMLTPHHAVLHFMAFTGCRRGEALGLRWNDVDLEMGSVSIVQSLQRLKGHGLNFQPTKSTKSRRSIALEEPTVPVLREHRGKQILDAVELGEAYHQSGLVFPGPLGEPLDPSVLTRCFGRLARTAGLAGVRLHDLRHFHATMLLKSGTNPKIVQERLGHSSIVVTLDTYSHVVPGLQEMAASTFAAEMEKARFGQSS